ncbi:MAG TPA: metallophosphoesterase family protein [Terriglobales bacterium]|nr:metallophosphoesterase family protein [Terriglobales bacterium]
MSEKRFTVGVISDTHGLLRPQALAALKGSDYIVHAGDVGSPEIIGQLAEIAPVTAVRGNVDTEAWARKLPETNVLQVGGVSLYVLHDLAQLDLNAAAAGFAAVISGHSHKPKHELRDGVLYLNPGSAGPRRFKLPVTVARLHVVGLKLKPEIVHLQV